MLYLISFIMALTSMVTTTHTIYLPVIRQSNSPVMVYGFESFCYPPELGGLCVENPSAQIAESRGGQAVAVDWAVVDALPVMGPSVGIGGDAWLTGTAYINGTAFGLSSLASQGPDAGDYLCGYLFAKLLRANRCSLFVHVPLQPTEQDLAIVDRAIQLVRDCASSSLPRPH